MRISDWSSDVCSSDLVAQRCDAATAERLPRQEIEAVNAGPFVAFDRACDEMGEISLYGVFGECRTDGGQVVRPARDHADIAVVALVARARPGQPDQRYRAIRTRRQGAQLGFSGRRTGGIAGNDRQV